jgi:hypothetical protein
LLQPSPEDTLNTRADQAIRQANTESFETLAGYKPEEGGIGINIVTDPMFAQARLGEMSDFEPPPKPFVDPNKFNINPFSKEAYVIDIDPNGNQRQINVVIDAATGNLVSASGSIEDDARLGRSLEKNGVKLATMPPNVIEKLAHYNPNLVKTDYVSPQTVLNSQERKALLDVFDIQATTTPQKVNKFYQLTDVLKGVGKGLAKASPFGTLLDLGTYTPEAGSPMEVSWEQANNITRLLAETYELANKPPTYENLNKWPEVTTVVLDYDDQGNPIEYIVPTLVKPPKD